MAERRAAWERASAGRASFVDFGEDLAAHAHRGLSPPMFSDEVHLTFDGYWRLAWLWSKEVRAVLHGRAQESDAPPPLDTARYLGAVTRGARKTGACILLADADVYLRADMPLLAASILRLAADMEAQLPTEPARSRAGRMAQLILGKMRSDLGQDPALPALLAPHLDALDLGKLSAELRDHPGLLHRGRLRLPGGARGRGRARRRGTSYMIPGGQDALIGQMLGGSPAGCSLERASIPGDHIEARFRCPDGRAAAIELRHPSTALPALAVTQRFLVRAGDPAPPAAMLDALTASIRDNERSFVWKRDGAPRTKPPAPEAPSASARPIVPFAITLVIIAIGTWLWIIRRGRFS
ncbi:MAG: hypothetical protein U0359_17385 [Byssovorax sp.]